MHAEPAFGHPGPRLAIPVAEAVADASSQLHVLALALRARWRLVAAFVLGGLGLMALVTLAMERRYTAMAVVQIRNSGQMGSRWRTRCDTPLKNHAT